MGKFPWALATFFENGDPKKSLRIGVLDSGRIVDLSDAIEAVGKPRPTGMRNVLRGHACPEFCGLVEKTISAAVKTFSLNEVTLAASITDPRTAYDFLGFEKHVRQIREKRGATVPETWYKRPAYYLCNNSPDKLFGANDTVPIPRIVEKPDYETEFALVVAAEGRPPTVEKATQFIREHCFFTLFNDWSARDYQQLDMSMGLSVSHSKSMIGSTLGPALVHAGEFNWNGDLPNISITCKVNGETRCEGNYNTVYWSFSKILAFLASENIGVFPGDVLGSGTVGNGCIAEFAAKMVDGKEMEPAKFPYLKNGDEVEIWADKIGIIKNRVVIQ